MRSAAAALLALALAACADLPPPQDPAKPAALAAFSAAYGLAEAWPRMAPKIARDSLPRLEDAIHADIDADALPDAARAAAHARVPALLPRGRSALAAALRDFDARAFARDAEAVYAEAFDTGDLRAMAAFYDSPAGRKLSALSATLVAESRRPGAGDVLAAHFDADERARIEAFWASPAGRRMNATAEQVREGLHDRFVARSAPAVTAIARELATAAEAGAPGS